MEINNTHREMLRIIAKLHNLTGDENKIVILLVSLVFNSRKVLGYYRSSSYNRICLSKSILIIGFHFLDMVILD